MDETLRAALDRGKELTARGELERLRRATQAVRDLADAARRTSHDAGIPVATLVGLQLAVRTLDREGLDAAAAAVPPADWSGSWAELTGYVQAARDGGGTIDPAALEDYLVELKRRALAPVRDWMRETLDKKGRPPWRS